MGQAGAGEQRCVYAQTWCSRQGRAVPAAGTCRPRPVPCQPGQRSRSAALPHAEHAPRCEHSEWPACQDSCPLPARLQWHWHSEAPRQQEAGQQPLGVCRRAELLVPVGWRWQQGAPPLEQAAGLVLQQVPLLLERGQRLLGRQLEVLPLGKAPQLVLLVQAVPQSGARRRQGVRWLRAGQREFSQPWPSFPRRRLRRR